MALDINGYSSAFKAFTDFAQQRVNANDEAAVANAKLQTGPLGGRKIVSVTDSLTTKNVITTCFPDMVAAKATGNWDRKAVIDFIGAVCDEIDLFPGDGGKYFEIAGPLNLLMQTTGCTLKEGADSLRGGKPLPLPPYISTGQVRFTLDLAAEEPTIVDASFSQQID